MNCCWFPLQMQRAVTLALLTMSVVGLCMRRATPLPTEEGEEERDGHTPLYIMGYASVDIDKTGWSSAGCIPAMQMALHDINARDDLLPGYELVVDLKDTKVNCLDLIIFSFLY